MLRKHRPQAETMPLPGRLVITVGLTLILLLIGSSAGFAQENPSVLGQVREIEPDTLGLTNPAGLAFSPEANLFYVVRASKSGWSPAPSSNIALLSASPVISQAGTVRLPAAIPDPINMAFDGQANRLLVYQPASLELVDIAAGPDGQLDATTLTRHRVPRSGLRNPQGMAVDPASGRLFFLDSIGPRIVRVEPGPDGGFDSAAISRLDLVDANLPGLRGLAFNPANGHLYTSSPSRQTLYELTQGGRLVASHDISSLTLGDPQGLVFAPSGDLTDDPSQMSLYIADSGPGAELDQLAAPAAGGQIVEFSFVELAPMADPPWPTEVASLVQTIDTSAFYPPSPDPAGIVYIERLGTLLMSDSEVDEMPMYFTGDNIFEMTLDGSLLRTGTSMADSKEPSGLAYSPAPDPEDDILFLTDDSARKIWMITPGPDGLFFTGDEPPRTFFSTLDFGCGDAEGIAFDTLTGALWLASGDDQEIFRIEPGSGGFGTGDEVVTSWDTSNYAWGPGGLAFDPENDPENGHLYLVGGPRGKIFHLKLDATDTLTVAREINISAVNPTLPAGVTLAPGSLDSGVMNLYVADRGIDNRNDPLENDGKVYELYVPPLTADVALTKSVEPAVASPGDTITYTLSFTNVGSSIAQGVVITDIIPPEVTVQSVYSSGLFIENSGHTPPYVWWVADMTTTDWGEIVVTGVVSPDLSCFAPFTNTATIATVSADTRSGNDSASVTVATGAGVTVDAVSDSLPADPDTDIFYSLWVTNTGACTDTFDVDVSVGDTDWTVSVTDTVGALGPGVGASVAVTVSVPAEAPCGPESATITFTSQNASAVSASSELVTIVNPAHGVTVAPPTDALTGFPSDALTYTLRMTNTGNCLETFDVAASEPNWITAFPLSVGPLYPGLGLDVEVVATVPPAALTTDQDVVTMTFASQSNSVISDTSVLTTSVGVAYGVEVEPSTASRIGDPNTGVTYTLQVTNTGNYTDTFTVSTSSDAWPASAQPTAVTLDPHLSASVVVTVPVPSTALCETEDHTTVTFTSESSGTISASSVLTTTANAVRRVKALTTGHTGSGDPDSEVYYDLWVQNQGNCSDILDISVSDTTWPVSTTVTAVELPPGDPASVGVTVTVPLTAHCGVDVATVTFTSQNDITAFDSSTLATTVNAVSALALMPPEASTSGIPGLKAAHSLWLTNTGNCQDTFTFSAAGDKWQAGALSPTVTLDPDQGVPISVTVAVPSGAQCTDSDVATVTYTAQNEATVFATSTLTTSASAVPALTVTPTSTLGSGNPGLDAVYALQVTNIGNCADIFDFSAIGDDWPASTLSPTIALDPLQGVSVPVSVTVPSNALCVDSDSADVVFASRTDTTVLATSTLTTSASAISEFTLTPSEALASGDPGAYAAHSLWLTNTGNCIDTFTFSATGDEWTASTLSPTVTLDPEQSATVPVSVTVPSTARCGDSDVATVTYTAQNVATVFATSTLTTSANTVPALAVAPSSAISSAIPGLDAVYTLQVTNTGNCADIFDFSAIGDEWPASTLSPTVTLDPDQGVSVPVSVTVPSNALCTDSDSADVIFTSRAGVTVSATSTLTTSASAFYRVRLDPSTTSGSGDPGADAAYTLWLTNTGNCAETFDFAAIGDDWPASTLSPTLTLDPHQGVTVPVSVTVPSNARCADRDSADVTFTSRVDGTASATSTLTTTANAVSALMIAPSADLRSVSPGSDAVYSLWLTNTGNCTDTFTVAAKGDTWLTSAQPTLLELESDVGASIAVTVAVPSGAQCGVDVATVTGTSFDGTASAMSTLTTTASAVRGVTVTPSGDSLYGDPGDPVVYNLSVTNDGNCADTFTFSASGNAWTTSAPSVGPVDPGVSASVDVTVTVHPKALCDVQDIVTATFTSAGDGTTSGSSVLTTTANTVYGVTIDPANAALPGDPGTGVVYTLWVTNTGNCSDTFLRSTSGESWDVSAPPSVGPLDPDAGESVDVTVSVPLPTLGGVSDTATVTFDSQLPGTATGSATLTTTASSVAPVAGDDTYNATEDEPLVVTAAGTPPGVLDNDDDANGETLTVSQYTQPAHGSVTVAADGSFTYTPVPNFYGSDGFAYHASDGVLTDTATVSITVTSANDDPDVWIDADQTVDEGDPVSFSGGLNDSQPQSLLAGESIHWDFGDGGTATGTWTPVYTYTDNDVYTVTLTVTSIEGDVGQAWLPVNVENVAPTADAGPDRSAVPGEVLSFHGEKYDPGDDDTHTFEWKMGDGTIILGPESVDHAYAAAGEYIVILTVTDDDGGEGTDIALVSVWHQVYLPLILRSAGP